MNLLFGKVIANRLPANSENFTTGWAGFSGASITVTPGQVDPLGGTTAYRVQSTGGTSVVKYALTISGRPNPHQDAIGLWVKVQVGNMRLWINAGGTKSSTTSWQQLQTTNNTSDTITRFDIGTAAAGDTLDILVWRPMCVFNKATLPKYYVFPGHTRRVFGG